MYQENERIIDAQKILLLVLFCKPSFRSPPVVMALPSTGTSLFSGLPPVSLTLHMANHIDMNLQSVHCWLMLSSCCFQPRHHTGHPTVGTASHVGYSIMGRMLPFTAGPTMPRKNTGRDFPGHETWQVWQERHVKFVD